MNNELEDIDIVVCNEKIVLSKTFPTFLFSEGQIQHLVENIEKVRL